MVKASPITPVKSNALLVLTGLSVAVLIISNIASVKLTHIGPAIFDAGTILFPLAYIIGDIITEIYGYKQSRTVVLIGFAAIALMSIILMLVQYLPVAPGFDGQGAYERILGFVPRIAAASLTAYLVGEFLNITLLSRLRTRFNGQYLWGRLIASSGIGELVDTVVFSTLAFAGTISGSELAKLMLTVYIIKVCFDVIVSPLTVKTIHYLRKTQTVSA